MELLGQIAIVMSFLSGFCHQFQCCNQNPMITNQKYLFIHSHGRRMNIMKWLNFKLKSASYSFNRIGFQKVSFLVSVKWKLNFYFNTIYLNCKIHAYRMHILVAVLFTLQAKHFKDKKAKLNHIILTNA